MFVVIDNRANNEPFTDRTQVDDNNGVIQFSDVTESEQGDYICTATSRAGSVTSIATIRVEGWWLHNPFSSMTTIFYIASNYTSVAPLCPVKDLWRCIKSYFTLLLLFIFE